MCDFCGPTLAALRKHKAHQRQKDAGQDYNRPIKTRRLKKADCEADFFFMDGI